MSQIASSSQPRSFTLLEDYQGRNNGKIRDFKKGETVVGFFFMPKLPAGVDPASVRLAPQVNVEGYIIPLSILKEVPKVEIAEENKLVGQTKQMIKTTNFKQGATLGAILGAGYGFFNNKSVFFSALVGMMSGGVLGHFLFNGKKTEIKPKPSAQVSPITK